ncbi:MAG: hypothetical protein WCP31_07715 [Chloroflexales bacterium]
MARDMADYVPVHERLAAAHADGIERITTTPPAMLNESHGYMQSTVVMRDGRSAMGTASFRLDLSGKSAQATNPIEDGETSAVGRALALLGYESKRGIASREEVIEARRRSEGPRQPVEVQGTVSEVESRTNDMGKTWVRFLLNGVQYLTANSTAHNLASGDAVTIIPGSTTDRGTLCALTRVDAAQAAAYAA